MGIWDGMGMEAEIGYVGLGLGDGVKRVALIKLEQYF